MIDAHSTDDVMMLRKHIRSAQISTKLKDSFAAKDVVVVTRQYIAREPKNDRRCGNYLVANGGLRQGDRRSSESRLIYCSRVGAVPARS